MEEAHRRDLSARAAQVQLRSVQSKVVMHTSQFTGLSDAEAGCAHFSVVQCGAGSAGSRQCGAGSFSVVQCGADSRQCSVSLVHVPKASKASPWMHGATSKKAHSLLMSAT
eukprot:1133151-Pelagomonas_calceolata.AAC.9